MEVVFVDKMRQQGALDDVFAAYPLSPNELGMHEIAPWRSPNRALEAEFEPRTPKSIPGALNSSPKRCKTGTWTSAELAAGGLKSTPGHAHT